MRSFFFKVSAVLGLLLFSQIPVFVDQYSLRLEGHLAECNRMVDTYRAFAKEGGKSLDDYIEKFLSANDDDFHREGQLIKTVIARAELLKNARQALRESSLVYRPFVFIRYADEQIIQDAWKSYSPGCSFALDGVVWSLLGVAFGLAVFAGACGLFASKTDKKIST